MSENDATAAEPTTEHTQVRARFERYADDALGEEESKQLEEHLLGCEACEQAFERFQREQTGLSGLHKQSAPHDFERGVEETIRRRSDNRFFGRRAFGDRVPFEVLAVIAIGLALAIYILIRLSDTGSLR
jgi:anti-sigma factor RsiW